MVVIAVVVSIEQKVRSFDEAIANGACKSLHNSSAKKTPVSKSHIIIAPACPIVLRAAAMVYYLGSGSGSCSNKEILARLCIIHTASLITYMHILQKDAHRPLLLPFPTTSIRLPSFTQELDIL